MNIKSITKEDVLFYCCKLEDHYFDIKSEKIEPQKIQRHAVAFANGDGGEIVIGITDHKQEPIPENRWFGKNSIEEYNQFIQVLVDVKPALPFRYQFLVCQDRGGIILHVMVEKSTQVHQCSDGSVYVRESAQSLQIKDTGKITQLAFSKGVSSFEDMVIQGIKIDDIFSAKLLSDFLDNLHPKVDEIDYCVNEGLIDLRTWDPKVCLPLLFDKNPSAKIARACGIKIARYKTKEDDPERDHLEFTETVEGNL